MSVSDCSPRAPLPPSWLIIALDKAERSLQLEAAALWVRNQGCTLQMFGCTKRNNARHCSLASYLNLEPFVAEELKDAIMDIYNKNHGRKLDPSDSEMVKLR